LNPGRLLIVPAGLLALALLSCGETVRGDPGPPETTPPPANIAWETISVTGSVVNLREGPGTGYRIVDQVCSGDSLMVTGGTEDWLRVYVPQLSVFAWIYEPLTSGARLP